MLLHLRVRWGLVRVRWRLTQVSSVVFMVRMGWVPVGWTHYCDRLLNETTELIRENEELLHAGHG